MTLSSFKIGQGLANRPRSAIVAAAVGVAAALSGCQQIGDWTGWDEPRLPEAAAWPMAVGTTLHDAVQAGDVEHVSLLIAQGADVNAADARGETLLITAALADQPAVATTLIEAGADLDARNDRGFSALHAAAYSGSVDIARMLLDHGVPVDIRAGRDITPLHIAGEENHVDVAELLLDRGADIEAVQANGYTPLTAATYMRGTGVMALLKQRGARCAPPEFLGVGSHAECMAAGD